MSACLHAYKLVFQQTFQPAGNCDAQASDKLGNQLRSRQDFLLAMIVPTMLVLTA
jgi:hypothetical protein